MRFGLHFLSAVLLTGCAHAQAPSFKAPGRYVEHLTSGGLDRKFVLHVPPGYDGATPIPVVVVLHGWSANAEEAEVYTQMAKEGDANGFATIFPDGTGSPGMKGWNAGFINLSGRDSVDDVGFVNDALDRAERELNVDKREEFVCGHSNGAFLANLIGAKLSRRVAAIGSVAGTIGLGGKEIPDAVGPISVILIHSIDDRMVSYGPGHRALLSGVGAQDSAKWWAKEDGCSLTPSVSDLGAATRALYTGGLDGTEVELVSVLHGSHNWPGGYFVDPDRRPALETQSGVNAADLLWDFFKSHPKQ